MNVIYLVPVEVLRYSAEDRNKEQVEILEEDFITIKDMEDCYSFIEKPETDKCAATSQLVTKSAHLQGLNIF